MVAVAGHKGRMDKSFNYIPEMMSRIGNRIDSPKYTGDELVKITGVMTRDLAAPFTTTSAPRAWS